MLFLLVASEYRAYLGAGAIILPRTVVAQAPARVVKWLNLEEMKTLP